MCGILKLKYSRIKKQSTPDTSQLLNANFAVSPIYNRFSRHFLYHYFCHYEHCSKQKRAYVQQVMFCAEKLKNRVPQTYNYRVILASMVFSLP